MNHRTRIAAAVLTAATIATLPDTAHAADRWLAPRSGYDGDISRCVTHREVWIIGNPFLTRHQLERRWEVRREGHIKRIPGLGRRWMYPICGRDDQFATAAFDKLGLYEVGIYTPNND